jgi:serine/threonine protein kinase
MHQSRIPDTDDLSGIPRRGDIFDSKFRIDGVLGLGGMGVVLSATHLGLEESVAIKLLLPRWSADTEVVQRFMREGRASIKIRSEHVVRVLDVGLALEQPYLVLEYLDGKDLDTLVRETGPLEIPFAVDLVLQACEALAEAHTGGVIHRDLKPANIFLTHRADGSPCVKVLDFGISKVTFSTPRRSGFHPTHPNAVMGSPPYMSPEQLQSAKAADARSDIWSVGSILYELETITELCARVLRDPPSPFAEVRADLPHAPEIPRAFEAAVFRCLEKDPANRFPNVAELARAFAGFGTASAQASAERIARIIERVGDANSGAGTTWRSSPRARAAGALDSHEFPAMRSRAPAYILGASAFLLFAGGLGWVGVQHAQALREAEMRLVSPTPAAPPPAASPPAPEPIAPPTSQLMAARPERAAPAPPPASAAADNAGVTTPGEGARRASRTLARESAPPRGANETNQTASRPPVQDRAPLDDSPAPAPVAAPARAPATASTPEPSTDPNDLFDGRK